MGLIFRGLVGLCAAACLSGCASLTLIHDPQTGIISRSEIPKFMKSVRCELSTFYQANKFRRDFYEQKNAEAQRLGTQAARTKDTAVAAQAQRSRQDALRDGVHFPIAENLFGGVYMNLKVVDSLGIGVGDSNVVNKHVIDAARTETIGVAPILNTQNTYEMVYSFLVDQAAGISKTQLQDPFKCYDSALIERPGVTPIALAENAVPEAAQFTRILVNAQRPLAAWFLDNAEQTWVNYRAEDEASEAERLIPVQMNYSFTVSIAGGATVRYSLVSPHWSPAQIGGGAVAVQSSQISIYLNGEHADLAGPAKIGLAGNATAHWAGVRRFVANPERTALKSELTKTTQTLTALKRERDLQKAIPQIQGGQTIAPQSTDGLDERIRALEGESRQIQERLTRTPARKPLVVPGQTGRVGPVRGYVTVPLGIAVPPN